MFFWNANDLEEFFTQRSLLIPW